MTNYTKTTDFAAKDSLPSGNAAKIVKGSEIDTEFNNIATASATKANANNAALTGTTTAQTLDISGNVDVDGTLETDALSLNGVTVTSTAAELNILDGVTSTAAELNILDGVTSTTAELNILDGVTSTAAELNILDGVTATTAELNYVDGVTSNVQTQLNTKAPLASPTFTGTVTAAGLTVDTTTLVVDASNNRVGIGTSSPDTQLTLFKSSTNADVDYAKMRMDSWGGSTGKLKSIVWDDAGNNVAAVGAEYDGSKTNIHFHSQYNGGFKGTSDRTMSIMGNGRVGIGTSSPTADLSVGSTSTSSGDIHLRTTKTAAAITPSNTAAGGMDIGVGFASGGQGPLTFTIGSTEAMRIDASRNVGIGTSSVTNALGWASVAQVGGANPALSLKNTSNVQWDISNFGGTFNIYNGSANRLKIDSSGNVGIGTGSPSAKLAVVGTTKVGEGAASNTSKLMVNTASGTAAGIQLFQDSVESWIIQSPASSTGLTFSNSGTERMRIDASGNLLVGTTSTADIATATPNLVTDESYGINDGSNKAAFGVDRINFDSANYFVLNASAVGVKLVNGATAWTTQSDETLKENITELTGVLSKVQNLRCVSYNLKSQNSDDVKLGFIAQDWQTNFPQVVNSDASDGKLGMNYTETIPVLLKAIQEQQETITALEARITQLENN